MILNSKEIYSKMLKPKLKKTSYYTSIFIIVRLKSKHVMQWNLIQDFTPRRLQQKHNDNTLQNIKCRKVTIHEIILIYKKLVGPKLMVTRLIYSPKCIMMNINLCKYAIMVKENNWNYWDLKRQEKTTDKNGIWCSCWDH